MFFWSAFGNGEKIGRNSLFQQDTIGSFTKAAPRSRWVSAPMVTGKSGLDEFQIVLGGMVHGVSGLNILR